ncbi:RNA polymerase sigma-70 factor [Carboxylicivirga sp. RSCT41]|uniref:RNA polymerase sigma-70 factor n=1 Tax=Carboxylicivirga agarovorans TaxID=3417570 RepID=UPI003D341326
MREEQTIKKLKAGDDQAFELLYYKYFRRLCAFVNKYLNDYEETQEVVQEVFYTVWMNRNQLDTKKSFSSFLFKIARNKSLNIIQHQEVEDKYKSFLKEVYTNENSLDTTDSLLVREINIKSQEIIDSLPEQCRKIYLMSRQEGKKYREIADELDISIKTVETQMGRALKVFRKELKEYLPSLLVAII